MARRNDILGVSGAETMIGSGVTLRGNLRSEGDMMVDGHLTGDIAASGDVTIGINGEIKGNITGADITVAGHVKGHLKASGEVTIRESGQVRGNIASAGLAITQGGIFIGTSSIAEDNILAKPKEGETE